MLRVVVVAGSWNKAHVELMQYPGPSSQVHLLQQWCLHQEYKHVQISYGTRAWVSGSFRDPVGGGGDAVAVQAQV